MTKQEITKVTLTPQKRAGASNQNKWNMDILDTSGKSRPFLLTSAEALAQASEMLETLGVTIERAT